MANRAAQAVALLILLAGGFIVLEPAIDHWSSVSSGDPFAPRRTTIVTEKQLPDGRTEVTRRTEDAPDPLLTRGLSAGGLLLIRIGIVALIAFIGGALVQRLLLGRFALKVGPLEVPDLEVAAAPTELLAAQVAALQAALADQQRVLARFQGSTSEALELVSDALGAQAGGAPVPDDP